MPGVKRHFFEFDSFRVEVEERRLIRNGDVVALTPRAFDILLALIENAGRTVDKEALMETVWQDTFVEEGNLNRHVSTLRRVLGDDPREQRYIKTIPKRGYRFTANVSEIVETEESLAIDSVKRGRLVIKEETIETFWSRPRIAVAAVVVSLGISMGVWVIWDRKADARPTAGTEARAAYERARRLWQDRTAAGLHESTLLFENLVQAEPQFARAHSALADAYAFDYGNWKKAEAAAMKAIDLDPALGEPHASIGFVRMFWEWRLDEAEAEFKKAVELSPDYATGHQWFALNLAATGHIDAALAEIEKAVALDPASAAIITDYCQILYFAEKFDNASMQCRRALEMDPSNSAAHELLYRVLVSAGKHNEAVAKFLENLSISKSERIRAEAEEFRDLYARGGIDEFRKGQIRFYKQIDTSDYKVARVLAESGETDAAVAALEEAAKKKDFEMVFYAPDPAFHQIRTGPHRDSINELPLK